MTHSSDDPFAQAPEGSQPAPPPEMPQAPPPEQPGYHGQEQYAQAPPPQGQAPAYGAPPPPYGRDPRTEKNWMGLTSLILSVSSLIFGITCIPGIIFGHMSVAAAKRGEANNGGIGRAGMILGYIFTVLFLLTIVGTVVFLVWFVDECTGAFPADWC